MQTFDKLGKRLCWIAFTIKLRNSDFQFFTWNYLASKLLTLQFSSTLRIDAICELKKKKIAKNLQTTSQEASRESEIQCWFAGKIER